MPDVKHLEDAVRALAPTDFAEFRCWFTEFDSAAWDRQIEADLSSGKLSKVITEATEDFKSSSQRQL